MVADLSGTELILYKKARRWKKQVVYMKAPGAVPECLIRRVGVKQDHMPLTRHADECLGGG